MCVCVGGGCNPYSSFLYLLAPFAYVVGDDEAKALSCPLDRLGDACVRPCKNPCGSAAPGGATTFSPPNVSSIAKVTPPLCFAIRLVRPSVF